MIEEEGMDEGMALVDLKESAVTLAQLGYTTFEIMDIVMQGKNNMSLLDVMVRNAQDDFDRSLDTLEKPVVECPLHEISRMAGRAAWRQVGMLSERSLADIVWQERDWLFSEDVVGDYRPLGTAVREMLYKYVTSKVIL